MPNLTNPLILDRCPHCGIANPYLPAETNHLHSSAPQRVWLIYKCSVCEGMIMACANNINGNIFSMYPEVIKVNEVVPDRAQEYLRQAIDSLHAPAGSIMLAASSVDAMLKAKDYKEGSLHRRINLAAENHLITTEMATWAHQVRLEANGQRHADEEYQMPTQEEAQRVIDFAQALAEFLFVLPAKVEQGVARTSPENV
ncbi:DUF4145 domain-containing protein [Marinifilum fragile]|uniref:DUF4145 domain-containing protein n=1 Tax=Marinifilum fragile TaxID=570161 RepID=UPI002AA72CCF|nr:DUF4145 domain-containing protein [Marinifilum fragile]